MNKFLFSLLLIYTICQCYCDNDTYTNKYDGTDLDEILSNDRLLTGYVNCLLDKGPCTSDGKELKHNLPDAIKDDCSKCTDRQREGADKVMQYIIDHRPDDWEKLEKKYDSDGSYKEKYLENMKTDKRSDSQENTSESSEYDDDADDEGDNINKDNYAKKDTTN